MTTDSIRIEAKLLIPGQGDPVPDGCVVIDGDAITYAGTSADAPETPGGVTHHVPVVMPGMWDCHSHFFGTVAADLTELATTPLPMLAVRAARDAHTLLMAGFTSTREMGGIGVHLGRLVDEGTLVGPNIYAAGSALGPTAGHSDIHWMPESWRDDLASSGVGWVAVCDGVEECIKAVRRQIRVGAKVIKINATGGTMSHFDHPDHRQFNDKELRAIVEEAAMAEMAVGAHCHGLAGVRAAALAGVKTIEHCSTLDRETAELMLKMGTMAVPTRHAVEYLVSLKGQIPDWAWQAQAKVHETHTDAMRLAIASGIPIATGADIMVSGGPWGTNGLELAALVEAGMTPLQAIEAATFNGPATLGPRAPKAGLLAEGYDADVIAVAANPLDDIALLGDSSRITMVWKGGRLVKSPGSTSSAESEL
ncbi:MAG: amidohydrolase family protein [bacterium]|nr:amidohydrolase family protein [bacterium]MDE0290032.1 amidohydrolase family protein [bacterium]MDE0439545.1 amidohydrolase family protein [bacterium]